MQSPFRHCSLLLTRCKKAYINSKEGNDVRKMHLVTITNATPPTAFRTTCTLPVKHFKGRYQPLFDRQPERTGSRSVPLFGLFSTFKAEVSAAEQNLSQGELRSSPAAAAPSRWAPTPPHSA